MKTLYRHRLKYRKYSQNQNIIVLTTNTRSFSYCSVGNSVQNGATISTNDSDGRKRMRIEYNVATTTHLWDKAEFFKRIHEIVLELRSI